MNTSLKISKPISRRLLDELKRSKAQAEALGETIAAVSSSAGLDSIFKTIARATTRALSGHACLIFLQDEDAERLILRAASPPYNNLIGTLQMELGEGLAGWAALTKRPIVLPDGASADPRFKPFPELDEAGLESEILAPVISRHGDAVGVVAVNAQAPHEFPRDEVEFVSNVAQLIAGAVENTRMYDRSQRNLEDLGDLFDFVQAVSGAPDVESIVQIVTATTARLLHSDLCAVFLRDSSHEYLEVRATYPVVPQEIEAKRIVSAKASDWRNLFDPKDAGLVFPHSLTVSMSSAWESRYQTVLSLPLISGSELLGLLNCYNLKERRYTPRDLSLIRTIANHAGAAIRRADLIRLLMERTTASGFLHCLITGAYDSADTMALRALGLGCDLSKEHCFVIAELASTDVDAGDESGGVERRVSQAARLLEGTMRGYYPDSLFSTEGDLVLGITSAEPEPDGDRADGCWATAQESLLRSYGVLISIGIGNSCRMVEDYQKSYAEARAALQIGKITFGPGKVVHFRELGLYRYLWEMSKMPHLRDTYQANVAQLEEYDQKKGTQLLITMEVLLESLGNANKASRKLFIHRNTLHQRLEKIREVAGIDLTNENPDNWLAYEIALKLIRLRQRGSARTANTLDGPGN